MRRSRAGPGERGGATGLGQHGGWWWGLMGGGVRVVMEGGDDGGDDDGHGGFDHEVVRCVGSILWAW